MKRQPVITSETHYHAVSDTGRTVQIFSGPKAEARAAKWVKSADTRRQFGLLEVREVTTTVESRLVYQPRRPKAAPAPVVPADDDLEIPEIRRVA